MKAHFILGLALAMSFSSARAQSELESSELKGHFEVSQALSQRILQNDSVQLIQRYLPDYQLRDLMGTWQGSGTGTEHVFRNGQPNSVNMLLWYMALSGLATDLGEACVSSSKLAFSEGFKTTLRNICQWPAEEAKTDAVLMDFWLAMMGYDAPEAEYLAWKSFFLTSSYKDLPAPDAVRAMALALSMNPFFLLQD